MNPLSLTLLAKRFWNKKQFLTPSTFNKGHYLIPKVLCSSNGSTVVLDSLGNASKKAVWLIAPLISRQDLEI